MTASIRPPPLLRAGLAARGIVPWRAVWTGPHGGRTNRVWRVSATEPLAVKLYNGAADTPLFPNDADAEWRALSHLAGTGDAPDPVARHLFGPNCLVYFWIDGIPGGVDPAGTCRLLRRIHDRTPPPGLRRLPLPDGGRPVFLHGDPVPGNVLATERGPCLIDWQCPAIGDPVHDLTLALSPSMRLAHDLVPLSEDEIEAALAAYGCAETTHRFYRTRAAFAQQLADHARWRLDHGDCSYAAGLVAERAIADQIR